MTPYASYVTGDPLDLLRSNLDDYRQLLSRYTDADWARPWAPGKWTGHQIVVHVTEWEIIFGTRLRCAIGMPGYVVQPMDPDDLLNIEAQAVDGPTASAAFLALRAMHVALVAALTPAQRTAAITHAERGPIDVNDLIVTMAGHGAHHLAQLQER